LINRRLKSDADNTRCGYLDAADSMHQEVTHLSSRFVSVVVRSYSQLLGTGGGCHGSSAVHTYDLRSGKEYVLADIVSKSSLRGLRATMPASIVAERNRRMDETYVEPKEDLEQDLKRTREALASESDADLTAEKIFVEKDRVFINVRGYYFSCAGGDFHPAEIPRPLITSRSIRRELAGR
jgi:hypothetical protein